MPYDGPMMNEQPNRSNTMTNLNDLEVLEVEMIDRGVRAIRHGCRIEVELADGATVTMTQIDTIHDVCDENNTILGHVLVDHTGGVLADANLAAAVSAIVGCPLVFDMCEVQEHGMAVLVTA